MSVVAAVRPAALCWMLLLCSLTKALSLPCSGVAGISAVLIEAVHKNRPVERVWDFYLIILLVTALLLLPAETAGSLLNASPWLLKSWTRKEQALSLSLQFLIGFTVGKLSRDRETHTYTAWPPQCAGNLGGDK